MTNIYSKPIVVAIFIAFSFQLAAMEEDLRHQEDPAALRADGKYGCPSLSTLASRYCPSKNTVWKVGIGLLALSIVLLPAIGVPFLYSQKGSEDPDFEEADFDPSDWEMPDFGSLDPKAECLRVAAGRAEVIWDGEFCRCTVGERTINPSSEYELDVCKFWLGFKNECESAEGGIMRHHEYSGAEYYAGCLCVANGRFTTANEDVFGGIYNCRKATLALSTWTSEQVGAQLSYYLSGLPPNFEPLVDLKSLKSIMQFLDPANGSRSVKMVAKKIGRHGGFVYAYRLRWGAWEWLDLRDPVGRQGDPRRSVMALGPIVGPFFGFEQIDGNTFTLPSLDEYLRARSAINSDGVLVEARPVEVQGQFGELEYKKGFVEEGTLPASEIVENGDQTYAFHDTALHTASTVIFPPELWNIFRKRSDLFDKSWSGIVESEKLDLSQAWKREILKRVSAYLVTKIDTISASPLLMRAGNPNFGYWKFAFLLQQMKDVGLKADRLNLWGDVYSKAYDWASKMARNLEAIPEIDALNKRLSFVDANTTTIEQKIDYLMAEHFQRLVARVLEKNQQCAVNANSVIPGSFSPL